MKYGIKYVHSFSSWSIILKVEGEKKLYFEYFTSFWLCYYEFKKLNISYITVYTLSTGIWNLN